MSLKFIKIISILLPILVTIILYSIGLHNGFVRWDDYKYVVENENLKKINWTNLSATTVGNYHPFTNYILSLLYKKYKLEPYGYHVFQLILHCFNVYVLYKIILLVKKHNNVLDYFITSLLLIFFSVHPFKVEDVSWVSEIKDVTYSLFYLIAVFLFIKQSKENSTKYDYLILVLFIVSLMFKSMAITLPILLFAIGKIFNNEFDYKKNKYFWYISAVIMVYFAFIAKQTQVDATAEITLSLYERPLVILYSLGFYLINFISPFQQSILYPFPVNWNTLYNYLMVFVGIIYLGTIIYLYVKKKNNYVFISLLFLIISLPIIQILPFGRSIVSERYTYLSYAALVVIISVIELKSEKIKKLIISLLFVIVSINVIQTSNRIKVWNNTFLLFKDLMYKDPSYYYSYYNIGDEYLMLNKLDSAQSYLLLTEFYYKKLNISDKYNKKWKEGIYTSLGKSFAKAEKIKIAKRYFLMAYETGENRKSAINNICGIYMIQNNKDSCRYYYNELRTNFKEGIIHIDNYLNDTLYK